MVPVDAGVGDRPDHPGAVDAEAREVRRVTGDRHAAGIVAGDDLVDISSSRIGRGLR